jgi:hypothetical protein
VWGSAQGVTGWETGTVVFVADDLASWLTGLLADAGRKKLVALVLGTDQERALRGAAAAAVRLTAEELRPGDDEQTEHVALVISQVFGEPVPDAPLTGHETVVEAMQAGIAGQLAVLDDAWLTGTRQSSVDVLGVPGTVLAESLTGHLLREIVTRGARGGPLFPLASQLNHDMTRSDSKQLKGMVGEALEALARLEGARTAHLAEPFSDRLATVFNVPLRNRNFTGRRELLDRLRARLIGGTPEAVIALYGLGGVGKTQLAIEYAHRHAAEYELIWWINAEQTALLAEQLAVLGTQIGLPSSRSVIDDAAAVLDALRRRGRWLLVFDNAESPTTLRPWLPGGPGHVLITSRYPGWGALTERIEVDVLTRPESLALLRRRIDQLDPTIADILATELGHLPLALEQAASYMETTGLAPNAYLDKFRTRREWLLGCGQNLAHGATIDTVWSLSFDRLREQAPAALVSWIFDPSHKWARSHRVIACHN